MSIRALREKHGIRQTQLAGSAGVLPSVVEAWEKDEALNPAERARIEASLCKPFVLPSCSSKACVYCSRELDGSDEHVLLSSLGGRLVSKWISCLACNNRLGSGPHVSLFTPLHPLLLMAGARDGQGRVHAPLAGGTDSQGNEIEMWSGGEIRLRGRRVERRPRDDGREDVVVYANSVEEAMQVAKGIARKKGTDFEIADATHTIDAPPRWQFAPISIGGGDHWRAIGSMALALLAYAVRTESLLGDEDIAEVLKYVNGDAEVRCVWWALGIDLGLPEWALPASEPGLRNVIAVSADPGSGAVIGRVVLLGHLQFEVVLSNRWKGEHVSVAYAVEPTTGAEYGPHHLDAPWATRASAAVDLNLDLFRDALSEVNRTVSRHHEHHARTSHTERMSAQAVAEVLGGLPEGTLIEAHHMHDLAATMAELSMGLPRESPLVRKKSIERTFRGLEARSRLVLTSRRRPKV